MNKLPPKEKIYEAWTAIADNRVDIKGSEARVQSSDGSKTYTVRFNGNDYSSDDNATFWRGYAGYPVIAVLMLQGRLPLDREISQLWKGINWSATNKKYRNDYARAVATIEQQRGIDPGASAHAARRVMEALTSLPLTIRRKLPSTPLSS